MTRLARRVFAALGPSRGVAMSQFRAVVVRHLATPVKRGELCYKRALGASGGAFVIGHLLTHGQRRELSCEPGAPKVIAFCSAKDESNPYRAFSNHHLHVPPFKYVVPVGVMKGTVIFCEHANKALHCTKASVFGDQANFDEIVAESDPVKCQQLGRHCKNFDQTVWDGYVNEVAFQVIFQKFSSDKALMKLLVSTGDALIAEAAKNPVWGIGLSEDNPKVFSPKDWAGQNIQGKALMRAREELRKKP
eukprot:TRINITY_DN27495_c0_g1_i1.p1 TRINITY_DN27495_c0_g1~~TRINITY_DN27495_c0_g1_i1.p1  ORF type:complete len:248 (-),score=26.43 TRINITY_DN27495_c0_g1_i1:539-1282(-)